MSQYKRKNVLIEARPHAGPSITIASNLKGHQKVAAGDYLVTDPKATEPKGSVFMVPKAEFEADHELVDADAPDPVADEANELARLLLAASHGFRSYENGNASPDLAKEMADAIDAHFLTAADHVEHEETEEHVREAYAE